MERPSSRGKAKEQRAWGILIVRIIFNQFGIAAGSAYLLLRNISFHDASKSMATKFKFACCQLLLNALKRFHRTTRLRLRSECSTQCPSTSATAAPAEASCCRGGGIATGR